MSVLVLDKISYFFGLSLEAGIYLSCPKVLSDRRKMNRSSADVSWMEDLG
jgi:hypothetical protein